MSQHKNALNSCYTLINFHLYLLQEHWAHMQGKHYDSDLENKVLTTICICFTHTKKKPPQKIQNTRHSYLQILFSILRKIKGSLTVKTNKLQFIILVKRTSVSQYISYIKIRYRSLRCFLKVLNFQDPKSWKWMKTNWPLIYNRDLNMHKLLPYLTTLAQVSLFPFLQLHLILHHQNEHQSSCQLQMDSQTSEVTLWQLRAILMLTTTITPIYFLCLSHLHRANTFKWNRCQSCS